MTKKRRKKEEMDWRWPETGANQKECADRAKNIPEPYGRLGGKKKRGRVIRKPICYPGSYLAAEILGRAKTLLAKGLNAIGCHTQGEIDSCGKLKFRLGEGGFEVVQNMERQAIFMLASMIGGTPETIDGYFCGGGTEANIEGLWIGREILKQRPDPQGKGIAILATQLRHYSIDKAIHLLGMGQHINTGSCVYCQKEHIFVADATGGGLRLVGMDERGQLDIECLEKVFQEKYVQGFRRFLIVGTVGTCLMGSIDPIAQMAEFISEKKLSNLQAEFYFHVDASFAGFTVPFVNPALKFGFDVPEVMSIAIDGDKMGRLPYPAGIFLCRKNLMNFVSRQITYVRGNVDNTVSGSRSSLSSVLAWYLWKTEGKQPQSEYVREQLFKRDYLLSLIAASERLQSFVHVMPHSPWVNFAPMEIIIDDGSGAVPAALCEDRDARRVLKLTHAPLGDYHLRFDNFPSNPRDPNSCPRTVYKICIMPHTTRVDLDLFVQDLQVAYDLWNAHLSGALK